MCVGPRLREMGSREEVEEGAEVAVQAAMIQ